MQLIDTHAHLTFEGLIENIDTVIDRAKQAGVTEIINVATEPTDFDNVLQIARTHANIFAAAGIHPHYAKDITEDDIHRLKILAGNEDVVAVGETGLDFHYNFSKQDAQQELFAKQFEIAAQVNKPVIVHSRNAFDETLEILKPFDGKLKNVVFHCYSGDEKQTKTLLDKGYYISFTGIVTFKNAETAKVAARLVPTDRMMLETDCPYMSPAPMRKQKINEPALLVHIAKFIAELKEMPLEDFAEQVTQTSRAFFGI